MDSYLIIDRDKIRKLKHATIENELLCVFGKLREIYYNETGEQLIYGDDIFKVFGKKDNESPPITDSESIDIDNVEKIVISNNLLLNLHHGIKYIIELIRQTGAITRKSLYREYSDKKFANCILGCLIGGNIISEIHKDVFVLNITNEDK